MGEGCPEGVVTEAPYGLFPMTLCDTNDHPTHPAHSTAAITTPANTFPIRSSSDRRWRCGPKRKASRRRRRRTDTDSRSWLS